MNSKKSIGNFGESYVSNYLMKHGFSIIQKNYRQFYGEIDIIARKKNLYVFVEVKTRRSNTISMKNLISHSKQQKIIKTAEQFISSSQLTDAIFRFDVALLHLDKAGYSLEYIENAFVKKEEGYHGFTNFY